jgi:hypothetical protein
MDPDAVHGKDLGVPGAAEPMPPCSRSRQTRETGIPAKVSMPRIFFALLVGLFAASSASAQQAACRYSQRADSYVGCQARQSPAPVYRSWGGNFGSGASNVPRAPGASHDWRYFGGYNALYGFGR